MGTGTNPLPIGVLCVDDNEQVAKALKLKFELSGGFAWRGWLPNANQLVETVVYDSPEIVLLDVEMPGKDPFAALQELAEQSPARVILFSAYVRRDLIDRAIESGAWGYVSKNDGEEALLLAIRRVTNGQFALSPEARAVSDRS